MDQAENQQDLVRCHLCENQPSLHCETCHKHICNTCLETHTADKSKEHKVVSFKRRSYIFFFPDCEYHYNNTCERQCKQCDIPICSECISSYQHENHKIVHILEDLEDKKKEIRRDLQEFVTSINPKHQSIIGSHLCQMAYLRVHCEKISTALDKVREDWHREIDSIINKLKSDISEMKTKHTDFFKEKENEIGETLSEIKLIIDKLKALLNSNDVSQVAAYKSRNSDFRNLPYKYNISFPLFVPYQIDKDQIYRHLKYLSKCSIEPEAQVIAEVNTDYENSRRLCSASCLNDDGIWTCGTDSIMRLYNLQGKQVRAIETKSKNMPWDIAVTKDGHLVYTDMNERTVNIVKNSDILEVIKLPGWNPYGICTTVTGEFLVIMDSDDYKHTKIVCFSANEEKDIQFNNIGQPLFSSVRSIKFITENKQNRDICVADCGVNALIVVSQTGKFRFRYNQYTPNGRLKPYGIATDSHGRILISYGSSDYIHILDQDGKFLRCIDNLELGFPWGICVDNKDNLVVADVHTGKLRIIQY